MTDNTSVEPEDDGVSPEVGSDSPAGRDRDGIGSLRDTSEESGSEQELADTYDIDEREAREAGVALDGGTSSELPLT